MSTQQLFQTGPKFETLPSLADLFAREPKLPRVALSIRQPWCWFITAGWKDIENRSWWTNFRGRFLIHAAQTMTKADYLDACDCAVEECGIKRALIPPMDALPRGGIVGVAEIADCVMESDSPWFFGEHGFVLKKARALPFVKCPGRLGFFPVAA
jgi:hypothetical protein